MTQRQK